MLGDESDPLMAGALWALVVCPWSLVGKPEGPEPVTPPVPSGTLPPSLRVKLPFKQKRGKRRAPKPPRRRREERH